MEYNMLIFYIIFINESKDTNFSCGKIYDSNKIDILIKQVNTK